MPYLPLAAAALLAALATPLQAAPVMTSPAAPALATTGPSPFLHLAAMGDDPATKHKRGGRKGGKPAAATTAGTPELRPGETAESAQKAYQKKYGF